MQKPNPMPRNSRELFEILLKVSEEKFKDSAREVASAIHSECLQPHQSAEAYELLHQILGDDYFTASSTPRLRSATKAHALRCAAAVVYELVKVRVQTDGASIGLLSPGPWEDILKKAKLWACNLIVCELPSDASPEAAGDLLAARKHLADIFLLPPPTSRSDLAVFTE